MKKMGKGLLAAALAAVLLAGVLLGGCAGTTQSGQTAAAMAQGGPVQVEAGGNESYTGDPAPTLEAVYFQSDEEARRYTAEMEDVIKNGLDTERELQSGI